MDECKVIIMGFGAVGQGVADALFMKKAFNINYINNKNYKLLY